MLSGPREAAAATAGGKPWNSDRYVSTGSNRIEVGNALWMAPSERALPGGTVNAGDLGLVNSENQRKPLHSPRYSGMISVTEDSALSRPADLVQGTLDLLILKILALEPLHGWAISQRLKQISDDVLQVSDGSLYPALHKLEQEGWIAAEWKTSELGRRAKFYALTRVGRRHLEREAANWERLSAAISQVVRLREA